MMQTTIINPVSCYGIGVHSGRETQITLKPAPANTNILFIRTDVHDVDNKIYASYDKVCDTVLSTTIGNDAKIKISTIEHLMAAIWGCGIDNLIVEIDGPEIPIMDGSSKPFVFMIECAAIQSLTKKKRCLQIAKEIRVEDNNCELIVAPAGKTHIDLTIDFTAKIIGKQNISLPSKEFFCNNIANARTFGFVHELDYLQSKGLALGASLDNTIGIDQDVILNHDGLRHENEFVRHKLLDLAGDLFTAGEIIANIKGYKTSHTLNNKLLRAIFDDPYSYQWV